MKRRRSSEGEKEKEDNNREKIQPVKQELVDAVQEKEQEKENIIGDEIPIENHQEEDDPEEDPEEQEEIAEDHREPSDLDEHNQTTVINSELPVEQANVPSKRTDGEDSSKQMALRKISNSSQKESRAQRKKIKSQKLTPSPAIYRMVWSEGDEIKLLEGMISYHSNKGVYPSGDMEEFYNIVSKLISVDFTKRQMIRKIARVKEKFQNSIKTVVRTGKTPEFSRIHEKNVFKLSKSIWGGGVEEVQQEEENSEPEFDPEPEPVQDQNQDQDQDNHNDDHQRLAIGEEGETSKAADNVEQEKFWSVHPCLSHSLQLKEFSKHRLSDSGSNFMKERLFSVDRAKAGELEAKWRQLEVDEAELKLKRAQLVLEQTKLVYK